MKLRTRTGHDGKWDGVREWKGSASFWRRFLGVKRGERVKTEGASGLFFTERATRDECEDGETMWFGGEGWCVFVLFIKFVE